MYSRILKFLTNLLFKQVFRGFLTRRNLTRRKKREPSLYPKCQICGSYFAAFNKRQRVCKQKYCTKTDRARQYRARVEFNRLRAKEQASQEPSNQRFVGPTLESEE